MKRVLALILAVLMAAVLFAACGKTETTAPADDTNASEPKTDDVDVSLGICIYKFDDTFMTSVKDAMVAYADAQGYTNDVNDSQNNQATQNDQVQAFITKGVSALAINPVDAASSQTMVDAAKSAGLPIVLFNREPDAAILDSYDGAYYVGAVASQSGEMSGSLLVDYWTANTTADKNGDGVMQYVMLTGEPGHQDAVLRTEYSIKAIEEAGIKVEKLEEDTAMWNKADAADKFAGWFTKHGDAIEAALGNNDDMALGIIEVLQANGYFGEGGKFLPVVGVDATTAALQAMSEGTLYGTVLNDGTNQGQAAVALAAAAATDSVSDTFGEGYKLTDGKYVWIDYVKVTQENYKDFM